MSFMKSIILNCEGQYNILGNEVNFINAPADDNFLSCLVNPLAKRVAEIAYHATYGMSERTNTLVHEMGHALTARFFNDQSQKIKIYLNAKDNKGVTLYTPVDSAWENTLYRVAGPMAGVAFETCKLVALIRLKNSLPRPISVLLGLQAGIVILEECIYTLESAYLKNKGDFGEIASRSKIHLAVTGTLFAGQSALGLYHCAKVLYTSIMGR